MKKMNQTPSSTAKKSVHPESATKERFNKLFFVSLLLMFAISMISCEKKLSKGDLEIGILESLEKVDNNGGKVDYTFQGFGSETTAKKCVKVTLGNGGTAKYCGPNTDKIKANCKSRGWTCEDVSSSEVNIDKYLVALDDLNTEGEKVNFGLIDLGDNKTAKKCLHVTFSNGGTTKYCGPNISTIKANCAKRGWTCKETSSNQTAPVFALSNFLDKVSDNADYSLTLNSSGGTSKWECTSSTSSGQGACVDAADEMQASGDWACSSVEGGAHCEEVN